MLSEEQIKEYITEIKEYWKIEDFEKEILNWEFKLNEPSREMYAIGHPINSHKGTSVGDVLPYTRLPEVLKEKYPSCTVKVPEWFWPFFHENPYVDGVSNDLQRWGSLGTWGTTVQRTCNVWGVQTFKHTPIIYQLYDWTEPNTVLICVTSKTGGQIQNLQYFEQIVDAIRDKYTCVQLAMAGEPLLKNVHSYIFNVDKVKLIETVRRFEYYIGAQNSIYHLSRALQNKVIGILPENVDPFYIKLPLLTQINYLEIEMLPTEQTRRAERWKEYIRATGRNPDGSHHCGWLYPDCYHLTMDFKNETCFCPAATPTNIVKALNDEIYPYNDDRLWDIEKHKELWK